MHVYCSHDVSWNHSKLKQTGSIFTVLEAKLKETDIDSNGAEATSSTIKTSHHFSPNLRIYYFSRVLLTTRLLQRLLSDFQRFANDSKHWIFFKSLLSFVVLSLFYTGTSQANFCGHLVLKNSYKRILLITPAADCLRKHMKIRFGLSICFIILFTPHVVLISMIADQARWQKYECKIDHIITNSSACNHLPTVTVMYPPGSFPSDRPYADRTVSFDCNITVNEDIDKVEECVSKFDIGDIKNCTVTEPPCKNVRFDPYPLTIGSLVDILVICFFVAGILFGCSLIGFCSTDIASESD